MGTPIPLDIFAKISYIKSMEYLIINTLLKYNIIELSKNTIKPIEIEIIIMTFGIAIFYGIIALIIKDIIQMFYKN